MHQIIDPETKEGICYLNEQLLKKKKIKGRKLDNLQSLYITIYNIEKKMKALDPETDGKELRRLLKDWRKVEYQLQEAWGFKKNKNYHCDYRLPHCTCPKIDNDDALGTKFRIVTQGCVYHDSSRREMQ